jgi:hypothetical protein
MLGVPWYTHSHTCPSSGCIKVSLNTNPSFLRIIVEALSSSLENYPAAMLGAQKRGGEMNLPLFRIIR